MAGRVADELQSVGLEYPGAAAASRAVRGATGHDPARFAGELDVGVHTLAAIETGAVPVDGLPGSLLAVGDFVSWTAFAARDTIDFVDLIDVDAVLATAAALPAEFPTRDVAEHELVVARHDDLAYLPSFASAVGRILATEGPRMGLERLPIVLGDRGAVWFRSPGPGATRVGPRRGGLRFGRRP